MLIENIMTRKVETVKPENTLEEVQKILKDRGFHHLLVEQQGKCVGVISSHDVNRMISPFIGVEGETERDRSQMQLQVQAFMSTNIKVIHPHTAIDYASITLLENGFGCLPVVDENEKIVGIVTWRDLLKFYVYVSDRDY